MGRALSFGVNGTADLTRPLTYVIYWRSRGGPNGHSAMIIDSSAIRDGTDLDHSDNYVSWMAGGHGNVVQRGIASTFIDDAGAGWGGEVQPSGRNLPNRWVALKNLDINAMTAEWHAIRDKTNSHWKLADKNCATVVARVLKAGCRPVGARGSWNTRNPIFWTPDGVISYARSLVAFIHDRS